MTANNAIDLTVSSLFNKIEKAAKRGRSSVKLNFLISSEVINILKANSFNVSTEITKKRKFISVILW